MSVARPHCESFTVSPGSIRATQTRVHVTETNALRDYRDEVWDFVLCRNQFHVEPHSRRKPRFHVKLPRFQKCVILRSLFHMKLTALFAKGNLS